MKVSDYIAGFLKGRVANVFGVQGGAVVHLFDSCERMGPKPVYCHLEQAAGFAATAYARIHGFGVCITTTGPGSTNALTPLLGAWQDSVPCLFISGQQRAAHTSYGKPVRQVGAQEAPIVDIVHKMSKYAQWLVPQSPIDTYLGMAYEHATSGRPGPVWLDIPQDVLWANLPT